VSAQTIIDGWEQGLRPLRAVHHQSGNFRVRVDSTRAEAFCYGIAYHYLPRASGESTRTFVGSYDFQLEKEGGRWRIGAFRFNLKFITGNLELETPEESRAASSG
jgi:SnoaL-like domain